jgi:biopolymer transport protein ExbB/TolQ
VLAYNGFARANRALLARIDGFAHDLHSLLAPAP